MALLSRTQTIQACLIGTIAAVCTAMVLQFLKAPPGKMGGNTLVMLSPVFFGVAAKRASHLGAVAVGLAAVGLLFGVGALAAALG